LPWLSRRRRKNRKIEEVEETAKKKRRRKISERLALSPLSLFSRLSLPDLSLPLSSASFFCASLRRSGRPAPRSLPKTLLNS
jgi:hypothetical protein